MVDCLKTCYSQVITPGTQVAYVTEAKLTGEQFMGRLSAHFEPGRLKVAKVVHITDVGFAEADGTYTLLLDNGDSIDAESCVVTDGNFKYPGRG